MSGVETKYGYKITIFCRYTEKVEKKQTCLFIFNRKEILSGKISVLGNHLYDEFIERLNKNRQIFQVHVCE